MSKILIVDDAPFWRDLMADALRARGHRVTSAEDGLVGLTQLQRDGGDLILLDVDMPRLDGFVLLEHLRRYEEWKQLPVIMLTGEMHKEQIVRAKRLGAADYLLKANFSLPELIERIEKRLHEALATKPSIPPVLPVATSVNISKAAPSHGGLDREQSLRRAEEALKGCALSGVVAQVMAAAASPRLDLPDLAALISHDASLAARVLQTSNNVAFASNRGIISTLPEAVRVLGCSTIRDIATSVGIFDVMPTPEFDGYNPTRNWQHSVAVAKLCDRLAPEADRASAYLIGLCHDLGESLFRSHFANEYAQVLHAEQMSHKPLSQLEREMLGITHGELAETILKHLGLPEIIHGPIAAFHSAVEAGKVPLDPMARVLHIADAYAVGALLAPSEQARVRPISQAAFHAATGIDVPPRINAAELRADVYMLTSQCVRIPATPQTKLIYPPFQRSQLSLWLARDPSFSTFDPISAALESLATVTVSSKLPSAEQLAGYKALVVLTRNNAVRGFSADDIANAGAGQSGNGPAVLWLTTKPDSAMAKTSGCTTIEEWPIPLCRLASFVEHLQAI